VKKFKKEDKYYDTSWANDQLKYAIKMCQPDGCCKCPVRVRFSLLIRLKEDLEGLGFKWQAKTLNYHVHRFQRNNREALQTARKGGMTTKKREKRVSKKDVLVWYPRLPHGLGGESHA